MTFLPAFLNAQRRPALWQIQLILVIGLFAYSSGALFVRWAIAYDDTSDSGFALFLAASRMAVTAICLLPNWQGFRQAAYPQHTVMKSMLAGMCLALYFATWMMSLQFTSIAASTTLVNLNPLWVMLLSWLWLRHKPKLAMLGGLSVAIIGVIVVSTGEQTVTVASQAITLGNSLALFGSFAIAAYILLSHLAQAVDLRLSHHLVVMYSTAAIVLLPVPLLFHTSYLGRTWQTYGCIVLMAFIPQMLGHTCINWSIKWVNPTLLAILLLTEPLIASGLGYIAFHEIPALCVVTGGSLILMGVAGAIVYSEPSL